MNIEELFELRRQQWENAPDPFELLCNRVVIDDFEGRPNIIRSEN